VAFGVSTISDVAREAGVSVATVSRALRGLDRVSPETRARVRRVAEDLHYVASPTATSLASGRTRVVAVIAPHLTGWFNATVVSAIAMTLRDQQHHVLLIGLEDEAHENRVQLTREMLWKRADGLIVVNLPLREEELDLLDRVGIPAVAIGTPVPGRPLIAIDDHQVVRVATEHLITLGHREIAFVGAVPPGLVADAVRDDRVASFQCVMAEHELPVPVSRIIPAEWSPLSAAVGVARLLTSGDRPTALVAASDEMAIGAMKAATDAGLSIPRDLSIVGVDDLYLSEAIGLTTVRQNVEAEGRAAAELMLDCLLEGRPLEATTRILPTELVIRSTTAPVPR
jgi:DNA-binding LacI/PurR family transcriptional regulator